MTGLATSVTSLKRYVGFSVPITFGELTVTCDVLDAKHVYGTTRLLVSPAKGDGQVWVDISRVKGGVA